jgi:hypothetical protein
MVIASSPILGGGGGMEMSRLLKKYYGNPSLGMCEYQLSVASMPDYLHIE